MSLLPEGAASCRQSLSPQICAHTTNTMGTAHKVFLVVFRLFEFFAAAIIVGFLAKYFNLINSVNGTADSRVIYAISMASISIVASLIFVLPLRYSFSVFPLDLALFICWIVCFALLVDVSILPNSPVPENQSGTRITNTVI